MSTVISNQEIAKIVAANFRKQLDETGLSMREIARRTGDSAMTLSNVLSGKHTPNVGLVARIAEALDVDICEMLPQRQKN